MKVMRGLTVAVAAVFLVAGCGAGGIDPAKSEPVRIVVLGSHFEESDPDLKDPGKWWVQFSDHVAAELGRKVTYDLLSTESVQNAAALVSKPGPEADAIAAADIVLVTVGGNQALPDPDTGIGCKEWFLEAKGQCLKEGVTTYGDLYDQVYARVKALRGKAPTVYAQTTSWNGNIESSADAPDGLLSLYTKTQREAEAKAWAVAAYDRWGAMQSQRARAAGFQVIDVYHALNGPDGTRALIPTYMDPPSSLNAGGHKVIAEQLAGIDLSAISGR